MVGIAASPAIADLAPPVAETTGGAFLSSSIYSKRLLFVNREIPVQVLHWANYFSLGGLPPALVLRMAAILRK
jgi:hypothetical protein